MGFVRSFEEIMAMAGKKAEFYGAEMLAAFWETKPEIVERLLPPPLKPVERPIAMAFVADYPKTNFGLPYKECGLFLAAQYEGIEGNYCLAMPVTDDLAMAGGREVFGYPKKMANIGFDNQGGAMEGFSKRHGVKYFQIKAELTGEPNDPSILELLGEPAASGEVRESFSYNFKHFPNPEGQGFDYNPRLIREAVTFKSAEIRIGRAEVTMDHSDHDPWSEVEVVKMLGAIYTKGDNTMLPGKVVAEVEMIQFAPYAFLRWDKHSG